MFPGNLPHWPAVHTATPSRSAIVKMVQEVGVLFTYQSGFLSMLLDTRLASRCGDDFDGWGPGSLSRLRWWAGCMVPAKAGAVRRIWSRHVEHWAGRAVTQDVCLDLCVWLQGI